MYAFLRKPPWLALQVAVAGIVVVFLSLGRWQLARLDERQTANAAISVRLQAEPVDWAGASNEIPAEYTRLKVAGTFEPAEEALLRSQVNLGRPGFDILTPLYLDGGSAVIVNRGWVPLEFDQPPVTAANPPAGRVLVGGYVRYPLSGSSIESQDSPRVLARVDLMVLNKQTAGDLADFYLELTQLEPAGDALPLIEGVPEVNDGPHLSYAVQWFAFALVSVVGFGALVRSTARRRDGLRRRAGPPQPDPSRNDQP